ncbi:MAG: hypothetical protein ABJ308_12630 [Halieaceae bacterium]
MAYSKKPLAAALGAAFLASAVSPVVSAGTNPFAADQLSGGYDLVSYGKHKEGKCGEGKCGEGKAKGKAEGKCGEGKCGEGKCGEGKAKAKAEGKCGEGKCGG